LIGRINAGIAAWLHQKTAKHAKAGLGPGQGKTQNFKKEVTWERKI
jgi:hypothetical protein